MSTKLRVAVLLAAVVLVTGVLFFSSRPGSEPAAGERPVVRDSEQKPGGASLPAPAPAVGNASTPTAKPLAVTVPRTPDPRLPATQPTPVRAVPGAPVPSGTASRPAVSSAPAVAMTPSTASPPLTKNEREAVLLDLDKVTLMLRDFRTVMGENPTGTNAEIMKALMGENPKGARLGPPENQALNASGELVDHWGTPLFFHQLSRTSMEIRSAGPDRQMYTEDDIITH